MAGYRPRQGWIYMINPYQVSLSCGRRHRYLYKLTELKMVDCQHSGCDEVINSSRVFRGEHPYIIWSSDQFQDDTEHIQTFTVIPLTSKQTFTGLPSVYPITKTKANGLTANSYALVHQICTVDGNCFKDGNGDWLVRMGQLSLDDKEEINQTLIYYFDLSGDPTDDWFRENASPDLVEKIYSFLPDVDKTMLLEKLLDNYGGNK